MGILMRMMDGPSAKKVEPSTMIGAPISPYDFKFTVKKGDPGRLIGRTKGGMNTKLQYEQQSK